MTTADDRLAELAARRLGAFNREDAHRAGLTDDQLRTRVRSGRIVQTGPHGFRSPGAALGLHAELNDVIVDVGPPVWAFGPTAAALLGFDEVQPAQRLNALVAAGFTPYQFTYGQVVGEPESVVAETRTALARHPRAA